MQVYVNDQRIEQVKETCGNTLYNIFTGATHKVTPVTAKTNEAN